MYEKLRKVTEKNFSQISSLLFSILIAFICGNIFGITSKIINPFIFILGTIIFLEIINFLKFSNKLKTKVIHKKTHFMKSDKRINTLLNAAKRGFLIGIFVEAFKVGS